MSKTTPDLTSELNTIYGFSEDYTESIEEALLIFNGNGQIVIANTGASKITGFERKELIGLKPAFPFWPTAKHEEYAERFNKVLDNNLNGEFESVHMRRSGEVFPVHIFFASIKNANGDVIAHLAIVQDISGVKKDVLDMSLNKEIFSVLNYRKKYLSLVVEKQFAIQLNTTLNNISDGFVSLDNDLCYTFVNRKAGEILGREPSSLIGKYIWAEFPKGESLQFYNAYNKALETQESQVFQDYYEPLDMWLENKVYPSSKGLTIYFTDITEKKKADTNNQILLSLIEVNDDFIGLANLKGEPLYLNDNGRQLVGLEKGEQLPASITDFFPEDYHGRIANEHMPTIFETNKWKGETDFKHFKTGDLIPIEMSGFLIKDKVTNQPTALGIVAADITKRKEVEERLIDSEQLFRKLTSKAPAGIYQTDINGSCNYVNDRWLEYAGLSYEEAMGPGWATAIHPEDEARILKEWGEYVLSGESELETDFRFLHKNNNVVWVSVKTVGIYDAQNNLQGYIGMAIDITDRKTTEEKLINSEQLFRRLSSHAPVGIFQTDKDGSCNYVNQEWIKYSGIAFEDALGFGWSNAIHPEDKARVLGIWEKAIATETEYITDLRFLSQDGVVTWLSAKAAGLYDANNELYGYIGTLIDITDRKEAEEKLINSEQLFRRLSSNAPVAIYQTNQEGFCNYVNEEWIKYSGMTFEESLGFGWSNAIHSEDRSRVMSEWESTLPNGNELVSDFRLLNKKEDEIKWVSAKTIGLYDSSNVLYGYIGTLIDITERKNAEEQIIKSEKYLENIINAIGDPIFVKDEESRILLVNDAFCSIFEVEKDTVIGKTLAESVSEEERESFFRIDKQVLTTGVENVSEETLTLAGRESRTISTKKTRFINAAGDLFLIGIIRDITERRKIDEEIRMAHQRLTMHLNNSPLAIIEWDKDFFVSKWSRQAENIFGWKESEALGKQLADLNLVYEEDIPSTDIIASELRTSKVKRNKIINRNNTKAGKVIYCQWYNSVLQSPDGGVETVLSLIQDVTERKEAEASIKESEEKFSKVFNSSQMGFSILNMEEVRVEVNDTMAKLMGSTREYLIGKTVDDTGLEVMDAAYYEQKNKLTEKMKKNGFLRNETITSTLVSGKKVVVLASVEFIVISGAPHLLTTAVDITDRTNAEIALLESAEKFAKAFDSNVIGKAILNKEKTIVEVNEALANIVGFKREDMLGSTAEAIGLFNFNSPENLKNEEKLWSAFAEKGYVSNIELKYLMKEGRELYILISLQALELNNEGHVLLTIVDITEKKNIEEELAKHRNNLEELIKVRTEEVYLKNNQLERMNKLFVNRELKMKELKGIIKELQLKKDN